MSDQALSHPAPTASPAAPSTTRHWRTEDWIAVVLGFLVITAVLLTFQWKVADLRNVVPTFRWTTDAQIASLTPNWTNALDSIVREADAKGQQNLAALSKNLKDALGTQDRKAIEDAAAKMAALGSRTVAGALAAEIRGHAAASAENRVFTRDNLSKVAYVGIGLLIVATLGIALINGRVLPFLVGVPAIFALAWFARLHCRQRAARRLGRRVCDLRAALGAADQQCHRDAGVAQTCGADRIFHQDRPRHPRRKPDLLGGAAGRRSRHRYRRCLSSSWFGIRAFGSPAS